MPRSPEPPVSAAPAERRLRWTGMLVAVLLAGCSGGYPDLNDVPELPKPTETLADRQAMQKDLEGERANSAYQAALARYETGQTTEKPVPPATLLPATTTTPDAPGIPAGGVLTTTPRVTNAPTDNTSLGGFMREMMENAARRQEGVTTATPDPALTQDTIIQP